MPYPFTLYSLFSHVFAALRLQILSFAKTAVGIFKAARLPGLAFTGPDMSL